MRKPVTLSLLISNRLFAIVLAAWLVVAALVAVGLVSFSKTDQAYSQALGEMEAIQESALNLNMDIVGEMLNPRAFLISGEESAATRRLAHEDAAREFDSLGRLLANEPFLEAPSLKTISSLHAEYDAVATRLIELRKNGKTGEALQLFDAQSDPLVLAIQSASHNLQVVSG